MAQTTDRTGPQQHAYQTARQVWASLQRLGYFKGKDMPSITFDDPHMPPPSAAYAVTEPTAAQSAGEHGQVNDPYEGAVNMGADMVRNIHTNRDFQYPISALVHEFAHSQQSPTTFGAGRDYVEGGAEAFSRNVSPSLFKDSGLRGTYDPRQSQARPYDKFVQLALAKGLPWVTSGQFQ